MKGTYKLKKDMRVNVGTTLFSTFAGTEIEVTQVDNERSKVLIDFGDGYINWFHSNWLDKFADKVELSALVQTN